MDKNIEFLTNELLPHTSRTFSLAIRMLPEDVKYEVGVAYNVLRLLDTIEDTKFLDDDKKKEYLSKFPDVLNGSLDDAFVELLNYTPKEIEQDWYSLRYYDRIIEGFRGVGERDILQELVNEMSRGFEKYIGRNIKTFNDLDDYCYYAAGIVGDYLTKLFIRKGYSVSEKFLEKKEGYSVAEKTGIFLQLVNIIRDFPGDKENGRIFYPDEVSNNGQYNINSVYQMIRHALPYSKSSYEYMVSMPRELNAFIAIPHYLAEESINLFLKSRNILSEEVKLSRDRVKKIIMRAKLTSRIPFLHRFYKKDI